MTAAPSDADAQVRGLAEKFLMSCLCILHTMHAQALLLATE